MSTQSQTQIKAQGTSFPDNEIIKIGTTALVKVWDKLFNYHGSSSSTGTILGTETYSVISRYMIFSR